MNFNWMSLLPILLSLLGRNNPSIEKPLMLVIDAIGNLPRDVRTTEAIVPIDIKAVQTKLASLGLDPGPIDGAPGPLTRKAVEEYQKAHNLIVDGLVGQQTWRVLMGDH